jgi:hypothetical protein
MKNTIWRIFLGVGLVFLGIIALLQVMNIVTFQGDLWAFIFGGLFFLGGLIFLAVLVSDRKQWWAAIPGFTLLGLGALLGFATISDFWSEFGAVFLFLGISIAFWVIYFLNRNFWWALIPAGIMLSLAVLVGIDAAGVAEENNFFNLGGVFLFGVAATFGMVALLPAKEYKTSWAWIPAGIIFIVSLIAGLADTTYGNFIFPIILILVGLYLVIRALIKKG